MYILLYVLLFCYANLHTTINNKIVTMGLYSQGEMTTRNILRCLLWELLSFQNYLKFSFPGVQGKSSEHIPMSAIHTVYFEEQESVFNIKRLCYYTTSNLNYSPVSFIILGWCSSGPELHKFFGMRIQMKSLSFKFVWIRSIDYLLGRWMAVLFAPYKGFV